MQLETAGQVDFLLSFWPAHCRLALLECLEEVAKNRKDQWLLQAIVAWRLRAQFEPLEPDRRYPSSIF